MTRKGPLLCSHSHKWLWRRGAALYKRSGSWTNFEIYPSPGKWNRHWFPKMKVKTCEKLSNLSQVTSHVEKRVVWSFSTPPCSHPICSPASYVLKSSPPSFPISFFISLGLYRNWSSSHGFLSQDTPPYFGCLLLSPPTSRKKLSCLSNRLFLDCQFPSPDLSVPSFHSFPQPSSSVLPPQPLLLRTSQPSSHYICSCCPSDSPRSPTRHFGMVRKWQKK